MIEVINMFIEFENTIPNNKSSLKDSNVLCTPLKLVKIFLFYFNYYYRQIFLVLILFFIIFI